MNMVSTCRHDGAFRTCARAFITAPGPDAFRLCYALCFSIVGNFDRARIGRLVLAKALSALQLDPGTTTAFPRATSGQELPSIPQHSSEFLLTACSREAKPR
jgi:hypothetical protein